MDIWFHPTLYIVAITYPYYLHPEIEKSCFKRGPSTFHTYMSRGESPFWKHISTMLRIVKQASFFSWLICQWWGTMYTHKWPEENVRNSIQFIPRTVQWRHNGRDGVSNLQLHDCIFNHLIPFDDVIMNKEIFVRCSLLLWLRYKRYLSSPSDLIHLYLYWTNLTQFNQWCNLEEYE